MNFSIETLQKKLSELTHRLSVLNTCNSGNVTPFKRGHFDSEIKGMISQIRDLETAIEILKKER